jgi:hypothetical protein
MLSPEVLKYCLMWVSLIPSSSPLASPDMKFKAVKLWRIKVGRFNKPCSQGKKQPSLKALWENRSCGHIIRITPIDYSSIV